jgi:hypothetical protein
MRPLVCTIAAVALLAAACASKSQPTSSAGAAPPAAAAAPAAAATPPTAAAPAPAQVAAVTPPAAAAGAPAAAGASAAGAPGRGTPPVPPPPPPAVMPAPVTPIVSDKAPSPDPRVGLKAGRWDAGQAAWNIRMISTTPPEPKFNGVTNSDLAFTGKYVIQGNYNGFQIYDITTPEKPKPVLTYVCPASQSDVSVYRNLLFVSGEGQGGRVDCGIQGVPEPVSKERLRGIRVFDISDIAHPKYVTNVQTCRGSHTHTVVTDPRDKANVYIYVSGSAGVRSADELPGCQDGGVDDPKSARFRIEVIKVPIAAPQNAAIISSPRIFSGLAPPPRREEPRPNAGGAPGAGAAAAGAPGAGAPGAGAPAAGAPAAGAPAAAAAGAGAAPGRGGRGGPPPPPSGPNQCHDITVYPDLGFAGGACGGYGLLLNIREVAQPFRVDEVADINMSFWHSATFSNDGTKVLFTDEWGGGGQPRCRDTDKPEWGADALFAIEKGKMVFKSYYKLPAPQTSLENCVAHNGSLIPIPGREVMVQGWYQGGISVFDWTDPASPKEIAFFDRGPVDPTRMVMGGSWSVYWYNGLIVNSEIARGLDIYELVPSGLISQNEIDAAKTVKFDYLNAQEQRKFVWPASFAKARAFLDQLERSSGLDAARISATRTDLDAAEKLTGGQRRQALRKIATQLNTNVARSSDQAKVRMLSSAITELAQ